MQALMEANKAGKSNQINGVMQEFVEEKEEAEEYLRMGEEKSKAAYWKAIETVRSITLGHSHDDYDDDLYDNYFVKKVEPISTGDEPFLDFGYTYVQKDNFFNCFKPEGLMHSTILDLKCRLLMKKWQDRIILPTRVVVSSIIALQSDLSLNFHLYFFLF